MTVLRQEGKLTLYKDGLHYGAQHKIIIKQDNGQPKMVFVTHDPAKASCAFDHYVLHPDDPYRG